MEVGHSGIVPRLGGFVGEDLTIRVEIIEAKVPDAALPRIQAVGAQIADQEDSASLTGEVYARVQIEAKPPLDPVKELEKLREFAQKAGASPDSTQQILKEMGERLRKLGGNPTIESHLAQVIEPYTLLNEPGRIFYRIETLYTVSAQINGKLEEVHLKRVISTKATEPSKAIIVASNFKNAVVQLALDALNDPLSRLEGLEKVQKDKAMRTRVVSFDFAQGGRSPPTIQMYNQVPIRFTLGSDKEKEFYYDYESRSVQSAKRSESTSQVKPGQRLRLSEEAAIFAAPHRYKIKHDDLYQKLGGSYALASHLRQLRRTINECDKTANDIRSEFECRRFFRSAVRSLGFNTLVDTIQRGRRELAHSAQFEQDKAQKVLLEESIRRNRTEITTAQKAILTDEQEIPLMEKALTELIAQHDFVKHLARSGSKGKLRRDNQPFITRLFEKYAKQFPKYPETARNRGTLKLRFCRDQIAADINKLTEEIAARKAKNEGTCQTLTTQMQELDKNDREVGKILSEIRKAEREVLGSEEFKRLEESLTSVGSSFSEKLVELQNSNQHLKAILKQLKHLRQEASQQERLGVGPSREHARGVLAAVSEKEISVIEGKIQNNKKLIASIVDALSFNKPVSRPLRQTADH